MTPVKKTLFLLDAMALIYRAYFVFQNSKSGPRKTSTGRDTSAVFGFLNTLMEVLEKENPTHLAVAFDPPGDTFRHTMLEKYIQEKGMDHLGYKGQREETPQEILDAIPIIKDILHGMGIPALEAEGYEADDVMGTVARQAESAGFDRVYLMTPDKDCAQLVTEHIHLFRPGSMGNPHTKLGPREVEEKFGVAPHFIADFLGLKGDTSDNIPGVPKVGDKTAIELISTYGTLEAILDNLPHITKKALKASLEEYADQGRISKELATIHTQVPIEVDLETLLPGPRNPEILAPIFSELELRTLARRILGTQEPAEGQGSLFSTTSAPAAHTVESSSIHASIATTDHTYRLVETEEELAPLLAELDRADLFCFDTETTGLDALEADIVGLAISTAPGTGWFVVFPEAFAEAKSLLEKFRPCLTDANKLKIAHNLKYDYTILKRYGLEVAPPFADTMLLHYAVQSDGKHGMDNLARSLLGYDPVSIETLIGKKGKNQITMREVPLPELKDYAAEDADITLQLYHKLLPQVQAWEVASLLDTIEHPLVPVLADIEWEGIRVDTDFLQAYSKDLDHELGLLQQQCYTLAGEAFNLNSPKQLGEILFDKLHILDKPPKTPTGQYKTDEETLTALAHLHELPAHILAYRQVAKLKSTYVDALPLLVNPRTGRVHTSFNQAVAVTGRLSSNQPNLQNIPIRTERGREVRKAFVPREQGWVLLSADYSQIELRIMAHLSGDAGMQEAFRTGEDIHRATAARIFGVEPEAVDGDMRRKAKTANFGIIYGITAFGLSQRLNISRGEAKDIIDSYFIQYPGVKAFMEESVERAREKGYVRTLTGRVHHLPNINAKNPTVRGFTERNAINTPIQGSAADLIKKAMIDIHRLLDQQRLRARMILQVHDELLFDVPSEEVERVKPLIRQAMEGAMQLSVPLVVDMGVANNWLDAH